MYEEIKGGVNEIIEKIRELIKEGGARRLIIKNKKGEVVFQTPLALGVSGATIGIVMAPVISAIGMFAMFINDYQILVEREPEEDDDEYSVEAEVIEIHEEDEDDKETKADAEPKKQQKDNKEEPGKDDKKTVGKKKD